MKIRQARNAEILRAREAEIHQAREGERQQVKGGTGRHNYWIGRRTKPSASNTIQTRLKYNTGSAQTQYRMCTNTIQATLKRTLLIMSHSRTFFGLGLKAHDSIGLKRRWVHTFYIVIIGLKKGWLGILFI